MMPPLRIQFGARSGWRGHGRGAAAGALLLLLAALAAAGTAHRHEQLVQQRDTLQTQHARLLARQDAGSLSVRAQAMQPPDAATALRLVQARAVVEPLAVPWQALFEALESVPTRGLQIQELVPDAQARTLRVSGQASALPAVLAYLDQLADQPLLGQVHLVSSQPQGADGSPGIAFTLLATWTPP